ncbi:MAG: lamin tail domain-containing protein [Sphingobacteriales bacterium]|nr:MAG: lamin tail domain-containing protein [Sphingobacteriales bacterium]
MQNQLSKSNLQLVFLSAFLLLNIIPKNKATAQSLSQVIITEINYNSDSTMNSGNWIELYNKSSIAVSLYDWIIHNNNNDFYTIGSGVTLASHAYVVIAENLFEFNAIYPSVTSTNGPMNFGFGNNDDNIEVYDGSGNLVTNVAYGDSGVWGKCADGYGRTLELNDYNGNQNDPANWFTGCMFGSPGVAYSPCNPEIVFSEINYKSAANMNADDWVEIHNVSSNPINLQQWSFKDENDSDIFYLPAVTIQPDGYRVLCQDVGSFLGRHPTVSNVNGPFNFGLSHKGEAIRLFDANGKLNFSVVYNNSSPWPSTPDSGGYTLELNNIHGHMNEGTNWFAGCLEGSPGRAYDPNCGTGVSEIENNDFDLQLINSLSDDKVYAQIYGVEKYSSVKFSIVDIYGREVYSESVENGTTAINISELSVGVYF